LIFRWLVARFGAGERPTVQFSSSGVGGVPYGAGLVTFRW